MRIHHLNCGSFCPLIGSDAVCHCLLIESTGGLILVDTGMGLRVSRDPRAGMAAPLRFALRPRFEPAESAVEHLRKLGFKPEDVRHIVLTHLDADHAGGIQDFPNAVVHLHEPEFRNAMSPGDSNARNRYNPGLWAHDVKWEIYSPSKGERWFDFECVRQLRGLPPEILIIPLPGHSSGHAGVAIQDQEGWLLHAGDAYIDPLSIMPHAEKPAWGVRLAQHLSASEPETLYANQARLRELREHHAHSVRMFSSHSPAEFEQWKKSNPAAARL